MSLEYIRQHYGVPAFSGARVEYSGGKTPVLGTIHGAEGAHLVIRMDSVKYTGIYHPTWKIRYLGKGPRALSQAKGEPE